MKGWRWNQFALRHGLPVIGYETRNNGMTWLVLGRLPFRPKWKCVRVLPAPWEDVPDLPDA